MKNIFVSVLRKNPKRTVALVITFFLMFYVLSQDEVARGIPWHIRFFMCFAGLVLAMPMIYIIDKMLAFLDGKVHKYLKT